MYRSLALGLILVSSFGFAQKAVDKSAPPAAGINVLTRENDNQRIVECPTDQTMNHKNDLAKSSDLLSVSGSQPDVEDWSTRRPVAILRT